MTWGIVVAMTVLGLAAMPHALANERIVTMDGFWMNHVGGLLVALLAWQVVQKANWNRLACAPNWVWPVLLLVLGILFWWQASPLHSRWAALYTPVIFLPLLLWFLDYRRIALLLLAMLAVLLLLLFVMEPYRLSRLLDVLLPLRQIGHSDADMAQGLGYQAGHAWQILQNISWLGGDTAIHLPNAHNQLLLLSMAEHWGAVVIAATLPLLAAWLWLTRPAMKQAVAADAGGILQARLHGFAWSLIALLALANLCVTFLLIAAHGPGLPLLSPSIGLMALAGAVMGLYDSRGCKAHKEWCEGLIRMSHSGRL